MSIVTLQLGQCGNQLGSELFRALGTQLLGATNSSDAFFRSNSSGHWVPRCLLVDMEPKVVNACMRSNKLSSLWMYDPANAVLQQSGSGASEAWLDGSPAWSCHYDPSCHLST